MTIQRQLGIVVLALAMTAPAIADKLVQLDSTFSVNDVSWIREPGSSTVLGTASLKLRDGTPKTCAGANVELLPVATYSSERIFRTYGNNRAGQVLLEDSPPTFTPDAPGYHEYVIKGVCNALGVFKFDKVPAGDYFVMVFIVWDAPGANPPAKTGGVVMKRIHVNPRATMNVEMP